MKKIIQRICLILIIGLILGAAGLNRAAAKPVEIGQKVQASGQIENLTALTLRESTDGLTWSETVTGSLTSGYVMALSGEIGATEYLDVASLTSSPTLAAGDYPFILDIDRLPATFYPWWDAQGVNAAAVGTWQAVMWQIINAQLPIFYLRVSSGESHLIDGLAYQTEGSSTNMPVRVSADYPLHTYNFQGTVSFSDNTSQTLVLGLSYTHQAVAELRIAGSEADAIVIDGCGYVDVTLRLNGVTDDLYALDLHLQFDPLLLEVVDLDGTREGVNLQGLPPWDGSGAYSAINAAYNTDDPATPENEAGKIYFAGTLLNPTAALNGDLDVAVLRLRSKGLGQGQLAYTTVDLSDRDGYLIGAPVIFGGPAEGGAYPVTTRFTAAGGLDLGIIRVDADTVRLSWPQGSTALVTEYKLHRSTTPYFTAGAGTVYQNISNDGSTTHQFDDDVLGDVTNNYFYALQVGCSNGLQSPASWQVGKFEYNLYETNSSDFAWVGFVLENSTIVTAQDLANHMEANLSGGTAAVKTVSQWNASGQSLTTYNHTTGGSNFNVSLRLPYRVEVDITDPETTNNTIIWSQVGRLPQILPDVYTLYETNSSDYIWVLQPLELTTVTNSLALADHVRANASADVNVLTVGRWNGLGQSMTTVTTPVGGTIFTPTRFGYPYRLEVDVANDAPVTWP